MTRDDIIRMARESCDRDKVDAWHNGFWVITQEELERFVALVAAAEREACAKVQEFVCSTGFCRFTLTQTDVGIGDAQAIRARGEQ